MAYNLYLDLETDGVRPDRRPWDVGLVIHKDDGTREEWSWLVEDFDLSEAEMPALKKFGQFHRRHPLAGGKPEAGTHPLSEKAIAHRLFELIYDATIAGIVVNFDTECLTNMMRRHKLNWTAHHHLLCVENRALGKLEGLADCRPEIAEHHKELIEKAQAVPARWTTDDIATAFGVPVIKEERHTGIGDARLAEGIFVASIIDKVIPLPNVQWTRGAVIRETDRWSRDTDVAA